MVWYVQNSLLKYVICSAVLYLSAQLTSRLMFYVLYYYFLFFVFLVKSLTKAHSLMIEEDEETQ